MKEPVAMIGLAFVLGYLGRLVGLPPLVGFLAAGFVLRAGWGVEATETITTVADLGVTLMLFTIGLKLKLRDLARPPVWAGPSIQALLSVSFFVPVLMLGGVLGLPLASNLTFSTAAVVAFAPEQRSGGGQKSSACARSSLGGGSSSPLLGVRAGQCEEDGATSLS